MRRREEVPFSQTMASCSSLRNMNCSSIRAPQSAPPQPGISTNGMSGRRQYRPPSDSNQASPHIDPQVRAKMVPAAFAASSANGGWWHWKAIFAYQRSVTATVTAHRHTKRIRISPPVQVQRQFWYPNSIWILVGCWGEIASLFFSSIKLYFSGAFRIIIYISNSSFFSADGPLSVCTCMRAPRVCLNDYSRPNLHLGDSKRGS